MLFSALGICGKLKQGEERGMLLGAGSAQVGDGEHLHQPLASAPLLLALQRLMPAAVKSQPSLSG